jgi:hypothetical protein
MALGDGGLDAQIEQRMDAYRGNPQKLQQRYGANKELLDLLALQKLTSEKKAVARDMQLKMQQNPNTIAQQREQEALQLTKQEMGNTLGDLAGRTKGVLDQKQKMQQKNMQQLAKTQPRKPAGIAGLPGLAGMSPASPRRMPPQAQGVANARMMQAVQQGGPIRMAGGGIVAFANGGSPQGVSKAEIDAYRRQLGGSLRNISDAEIVNRIKQNLAPPTGFSRAKDFLTGLGKGRGLDLAKTQRQEKQTALDLAAAQTQADMSPNPKAMGAGFDAEYDIEAIGSGLQGFAIDDLNAPDMADRAAPPNIPSLPPSGVTTAQDLSLNKPVPVKPDATQSSEKGAPKNITGIPAALEKFKRTSGAPSASGGGVSDLASVLQSSASAADDILGRSDKAARFAEMLEESRAKEAELFSPESQQRDRLSKFLTGGANTTTLGGLAKGAVDASQATKAKQNADAMARMAKRFELEVSGMNVDATLGGAALGLGKTVYGELQANNRTAQQIAADYKKAELTALVEQSKLEASKFTDDQRTAILQQNANTQEKNAATNAAQQELALLKENNAEAARVQAAQSALDKAQLEEWSSISSTILQTTAAFVTSIEAQLDAEIEALRSSKTLEPDADKKAAIDVQISEKTAQRNNAALINGMATNKANALFASDALPGGVGKLMLDRLDQLTPLVQGQLGEQGGTPLGEVVSSNYTPEG